MKKFITLLMPVLIMFGTLAMVPNLAYAQPTGGDPVQDGLRDVGQAFPNRTEQDIGDLLHTIINWALYIAAILAVIMIIWGGYLYITSAGNDTQAGQGRRTLTNAIIGLVIVILSYMIVQVIYNFLVD